jgi:DNA-binding HxlR family transcriptional regulator
MTLTNIMSSNLLKISKSAVAPSVDTHVCDVFHRAVELIGRRWSGAMIAVMMQGASRFCELRQGIPGISDRLLTERLKELERAGVLSREVLATRPPQVSYTLTGKGRALAPVIALIRDWGRAWEDGGPRGRRSSKASRVRRNR